MKHISWQLMLACVGFCGLASADPVVVKTLSHETSASPDKAVVGSGLAFERAGQIYVVLSERAQLAGDASAFRQSVAVGSKTFGAEIVATDWSRGIALWRVAAGSDLQVSGDLFAPAQPGFPKSKVQVTGVPKDDLNPMTQPMGLSPPLVISASSDRHAYFGLNTVLEVIQVKVDSGYAGGLVRASDGQWLGLVSSQYLQLMGAKPTQLFEWDAGHVNQVANHVVVIPAQDVVNFVTAALSGTFQPVALQSGRDRVSGKSRVTVGALEFQEICPPAAAPAPMDGTFPIGGSEGIGIGGSYTMGRKCRLAVSLAGTPVSGFVTGPLAELQAALQPKLSAQKLAHSEIWYRMKRDAMTQVLEGASFGGVPEFLRDLVKDRGRGVWLATAEGATESGLDPAAADLRVRARAVETAALATLADGVMTGENRDHIGQIHFLAKVLTSESWSTVVRSDVERLLDDKSVFKLSWGTLLPFSPHAKALWAALEDLRDEMPL